MMNLVRLSDNDSLQVDLLDYGARIASIRYKGQELALRYPKLEDYLTDQCYVGATVGPICNRIANSALRINQYAFALPANEGPNCLHSGGHGFDRQFWQLDAKSTSQARFKLEYDLAQIGMLGLLTSYADFQTKEGVLSIDYWSSCDHDTYVNLTNHVYLNLSGDPHIGIDDHRFELHADSFVNVDAQNIPDGELTKLDKPMEYSLSTKPPYSEFTGGCDHHFNSGTPLKLRAQSLSSGMNLKVSSTSPGFQFYTGRHLRQPFAESSGFCVETQFAPDAINQAGFYAPILKKGELAHSSTRFAFSKGLSLEL